MREAKSANRKAGVINAHAIVTPALFFFANFVLKGNLFNQRVQHKKKFSRRLISKITTDFYGFETVEANAKLELCTITHRWGTVEKIGAFLRNPRGH